MLNTVLTVISALCTFVSVVSAIKSKKYYKKSKLLATFAAQNTAYSESLEIISAISDILQAEKRSIARGKNQEKTLSEIGLRIRASLDEVRRHCSGEDGKEILLLIDSKDVMGYINKLIVNPLFGMVMQTRISMNFKEKYIRCTI